jgi:hypothetical protein
MAKRWCRSSSAAICAVLMVALTGMANAKDDTMLLKQLQETIAKVRTMKGPSMARTNEAEHLVKLTKRIDPKKVDDKTLADLIALLNTSDDSVRGWVAGALGYLGPRAKVAVSALLKLTHETDCIELAELKSAGAARVALKRIGVTPPPPPNCDATKEQK